MSKKLRSVLSVLLAAALLLCVCAVPVGAAEQPLYVVLGDSIAYGSGLSNPREAVYGRIVADTNGYDYENFDDYDDYGSYGGYGDYDGEDDDVREWRPRSQSAADRSTDTQAWDPEEIRSAEDQFRNLSDGALWPEEEGEGWDTIRFGNRENGKGGDRP